MRSKVAPRLMRPLLPDPIYVRRKPSLRLQMIARRHAQLPQIVDALAPPCRLARRLNRGQQQRNQDANDRDHDEKLDEREPARRTTTEPAHVRTSRDRRLK